ncbi:MAG: hypothetical protein ILA34_02870 [Bacteroidaceae bacterium]|nr:hypothetical protein [Bacteroidaceae bacterium]
MGVLLGLMMLILLGGCGSDREDRPQDDPVLMKIYLYMPEAPIISKAVTSDIASDMSEENAIRTLDVWVFDQDDSDKLLGYAHETDVVLTGGAKEISIALEGIADTYLNTLRTHRASVYAIANQGSLGLGYTSATPRTTIAATTMGGTQFGVKDGGSGTYVPTHPVTQADRTALDDGLPMAGAGTGLTIGGAGKVIQIPQVQMYRAVSKLRFVFTRTAAMGQAAIRSITLTGGRKGGADGGHIATTENLFTTTGDATVSITPNSYVSGTIAFGSLANSDIAAHPDPLSLLWRSDNKDQTYETTLNTAIGNGTATEWGRCYLRETDRKLHGRIVYTTDGITEKTMEFEMDAENDFVRNHAWTVFGYFYNGELQLRMDVARWSTWTEQMDYKDEVTVTETINWDEETIAGTEVVLDSKGIYDRTVVTLIPSTTAVCYFSFNTPVSGTWYATLETIGGTYGAIVFDNGTPEGTLTMSGSVGPRATLRIRSTIAVNTEQRNRARITFAVRNQAGDKVYRADKGVMGAAIEILQPVD